MCVGGGVSVCPVNKTNNKNKNTKRKNETLNTINFKLKNSKRIAKNIIESEEKDNEHDL